MTEGHATDSIIYLAVITSTNTDSSLCKLFEFFTTNTPESERCFLRHVIQIHTRSCESNVKVYFLIQAQKLVSESLDHYEKE